MAHRNFGSLIGKRYRLVERIGAGELGEVWRARHEAMGREVALKLVAPKWPVTDAMTNAFLRDVRASGRLEEPTLVQLLDCGEHQGMPFVVMPLLHAEKLERLLDRRGALPMGTALRLVADLALGLAAAHEHRVFHGQIEPANVLLRIDARGKVVPTLIDFGIVRLVGDRERQQLPGPIGYLAPEQAVGEVGDGRADVWSLAILLCHAIEGHAPFTVPRQHELMEELDEGITALVARVGRRDEKLRALLRDTLVMDKTKRPTARMFARRVNDLSMRARGQLEALARVLVIPEALDSAALRTIVPPPPPAPPPRAQRLVGRRTTRRRRAVQLAPPAPASGAITLDVKDEDISSIPPRS